MSEPPVPEGSKSVPRREFVFILHDLLESCKFPDWLRWVPTEDGSPSTEFQVTANPQHALIALQALTSSKDLGNIIRQLSYWNFKRKTDIRAKPNRSRDHPPEGFVTWSHSLPVFIQGDSSRLAEIKRNPTKGSRGAKKAEEEAAAAKANASASASPVPDQPVAPPEPKQEEGESPRPVKRLKLTMRGADELSTPSTPPQSQGQAPAALVVEAAKKDSPPARPRARLEVDQSLSGDVVDDKGVVRSFAPAPPAGTNYRNEIKWGRIQG